MEPLLLRIVCIIRCTYPDVKNNKYVVIIMKFALKTIGLNRNVLVVMTLHGCLDFMYNFSMFL